jgi:aspartate/methionine/tyrosine aminotransferase
VENSTSVKFDLGFGNSVCVRQAFLDCYHGNMVVFTQDGLSKMDYSDRYGDPELIEITRTVIKRQVGIEKKHVFLTNGATGAVTISLRAMKQRGKNICYTRDAPWYLRYPSMIRASGLIQLEENKGIDPEEGVVLLDIPSNPQGFTSGIRFSTAPTILDAVYFNRVYMAGYFVPVIAHNILCGSYSKLLGLNGLRVGWIATNDDLLAERIKDLIIGEYCSLSSASTEIIKNVLFDFDWDLFETIAKSNLDNNREEWSKLEKFFEGRPVTDNGMFYYGKMDSKCQDLLAKSGISWTKGSDLGTDDGWGRINLGQDCDLIRKAVAEVSRRDGGLTKKVRVNLKID